MNCENCDRADCETLTMPRQTNGLLIRLTADSPAWWQDFAIPPFKDFINDLTACGYARAQCASRKVDWRAECFKLRKQHAEALELLARALARVPEHETACPRKWNINEACGCDSPRLRAKIAAFLEV